MGRLHFRALALLVLVGGQVQMGSANAQPALPGPMRVRESKPVTVNDAKFVVVAQSDWQPAKPDNFFPMVAPIQIQLRITNLRNSNVLFPTFNTFGIKLIDADGNEVKTRGKPNGTNSTSPVLLPEGTS